MQKFNNFSSGAAPSFLRTHPITTERISDIEDRLGEYGYQQRSNRIEFYLVKSKLEAYLGDIQKVSNLFESNIKSGRYLNKKAAYFGLIYTQIRNQKIVEARENFDLLKKLSIESPMMIELEANLLINEKKFKEAYHLYEENLKIYPYYTSFIIGLSKLLINFNKLDDAIEFLKKYIDIYKDEPILYELLAKAYSLKGEYLLEHENLSNFYYYQFNIHEAIKQMDLATKTKSQNFYNLSRVEYKLKKLSREQELMDIQ